MSQMIPDNQIRLQQSKCSWTTIVLVVTALILSNSSGNHADDTSSQGTPDWKLITTSNYVEMFPEKSSSEDSSGVTRLKVTSTADFQNIRIVIDQLPAQLIDDFKATVKVRATLKSFRLALRLVLPHQIDPRSGTPLVTFVSGDTYKTPDIDQVLSVSGTNAMVTSELRRLRTELHQQYINAAGAYFDGCALIAEVHKGVSYFNISQVTYGPVVTPDSVIPSETSTAGKLVRQRRVRVERDSVMIDEQPAFLRVIPDHGESAQYLKQLGVNGVWVPQADDEQRIRAMNSMQLLTIATPPHPQFDPANFDVPVQGLSPLEQTLPHPDLWYLGTRVAKEQQKHLLAWAREIRSADRILRRPLMVDVVSAEGVASRQIDLVGISQSQSGSLSAFGDARNKSYRRRHESAQLTFPWEWIQTEPSPAISRWRQSMNSVSAYIEPEQIMLQLISAVSAGSRGAGYWKSRSLESNDPRDAETARAIELANLYVDVISPLLVEGRIDGHLGVSLSSTPATAPVGSGLVNQILGSPNQRIEDYRQSPSGPDAAVINCPGRSLILVGFWDEFSHYVPHELFAAEATLTVSATETSSAFQITATGVQGLRREPTAGGLFVRIREMDQLALVLISSNPDHRRQIETRVHEHAERAGELLVELAELKLARVAETCRETESLVGKDPAVNACLAQAQQQSESARAQYLQGNFSVAERQARNSMRLTRRAQTQLWQAAVSELSTPAASPHTINFSTLPDHWRMMQAIMRSTISEELVQSGSFDNLRMLSQGNWEPTVPQESFYHGSADIVTDNRGPNQVLRLRAWQRGSEAPADDGPTLLVKAPDMMVRRGDILEIKARIRLGHGIHSVSEQPFFLFDTDLGPESAVSPKLESSWQTVRMYRQSSQDGPFKVWFGLKGSAEVFLDDFSVINRSNPASTQNDPQINIDRPSNPTSGVQGAGYSRQSLP